MVRALCSRDAVSMRKKASGLMAHDAREFEVRALARSQCPPGAVVLSRPGRSRLGERTR